MRAALTTTILVLMLALAACGDDDDGAASAPEGACEDATAPEPRPVELGPPPKRPSASRLTAIVDTSCGTFEIDLDTKTSPKTVASFEYLVENGVYDNSAWHRIAINPPVIQGGDPLATGTGGPGYTVDERPPQDTAYTKGVVGMAKTEVEPPGRSGSQFFVVTGADAGLPPIYALLGEVSKGHAVVERISQYGDPSGSSETPLEPVVIDSITIEEG